jgi:hypothetical protein
MITYVMEKCAVSLPDLVTNSRRSTTAHDERLSSTSSANKRLLSCRRSVAPDGMLGGGVGSFRRGDIQWRANKWGDPARDALTWCIPTIEFRQSDGTRRFRGPHPESFGTLYGARTATGSGPPSRSHQTSLEPIDRTLPAGLTSVISGGIFDYSLASWAISYFFHH